MVPGCGNHHSTGDYSGRKKTTGTGSTPSPSTTRSTHPGPSIARHPLWRPEPNPGRHARTALCRCRRDRTTIKNTLTIKNTPDKPRAQGGAGGQRGRSQHTKMNMHPVVVFLSPGEHAVCHCGESSEEPLCDGQQGSRCQHAKKFLVEKEGPVPLCLCGQTQTPPVCDGNHGYEKKRPRPSR